MLVILYKKDMHGKLKYYVLDDRQANLFSQHTLHIGWGSSPNAHARRHYSFETLAEKDKKIRSILKRKLIEYQILYSYFKDAHEKLSVGSMVEVRHVPMIERDTLVNLKK